MNKTDNYAALLKKYESLVNQKDSILQSVYNDLMYKQPVKYSLRSKLIKHCKERGLDLPKEIDFE